MQKPRQRWAPKGIEKPREVKARKGGERVKDRERGRRKAEEGRKGREESVREDQTERGLPRPLRFPSPFSALLLSGSGLLARPSGCPPGAPSLWQMAAPSSFIWPESDQHSAQRATSAPRPGGESLPGICGTLMAEMELDPQLLPHSGGPTGPGKISQ